MNALYEYKYKNNCKCSYMNVDGDLYCESGYKWCTLNMSSSLRNFLLKASDLIPNFFELSMLNSEKFNEMMHVHRLSRTFFDECGDVIKAYCYDRFGRFLKENFKINELINEMNKHDDLRILNKSADNKYVLNDKFWNVDFFDLSEKQINYYNIFRNRKFNQISAKVFTFIVIDILFTRIMFARRFKILLCEDSAYYRECHNEDFVQNCKSIKCIGDNFVFYLHKVNDACINYLLKKIRKWR